MGARMTGDEPPADDPWAVFDGDPLAAWEMPMPQSSPPTFPGAMYDGSGTRLQGDGPESITLEYANGHPFTVMLGKKEILARHEALAPEDRIWLLPDSLGTPSEMPATILEDLADRLTRGQRIGLAGNNPELGLAVQRALALLYASPEGQA
jgi:hypothetical protein